jgi:asparagine synthase (glutamine-hydrolysing)
MCGIYGALALRDSCPPPEEILTRMGTVVMHRGPDDHGHYCDKQIVFGMRRLSIIDVAGGRQPIANETNKVWVVCNGELYNFRDLRRDLQTRGHTFRSMSDTEVLVHLYEEFGLDFVKKLHGMFALALWDGGRSTLVLARDRLGKKPLYIYRQPHRIWFASEIKSLLEVGEVPRNLSTAALREYLALGYVPAPWTLFEGIEKLLPGHCLVVEKGQVRDLQYWDIPVDPPDTCSEEEWIERIRERLMESVRMRMVSDVPLGAFLSGGIDSSAIVAAMARTINQPVKTYSIGFEGPDSFYNELPYARIVAKAYATEHHEIVVRPEIVRLLPTLIWHMDEPIADSAFITTYLVARLASESVKVILSGVGGDELFGGYRRYLGNQLAKYYRWVPNIARKRWVPDLLAALRQDRHSYFKNLTRYADAFFKTAELNPAERYLSYITLFSRDAQTALLRDDIDQDRSETNGFASRVMSRHFGPNSLTGLQQLIYADLKTSLPDDLLVLTDKMTMAASIECRAPFLDHELVELSARMPDSLKVRGLKMKYLLKKVVKPWLPAEILHRTKRGFGAPMGAWLRGDLAVLVQNLLSEEQINRRGLFNWAFVKEMVLKHNTQRQDYTDQLLALINLELWCRVFLDGLSHCDPSAVMARG